MDAERILFVEDDQAGREMGAYNLRKAGYHVDVAATGEEGLALFDPSKHAAVITDVRMPGISGLELLGKIAKRAPEVPVLVITAYGNVDLAVEAMRAGAFDFIGKPFNRDHLLLTVRRALERYKLRVELRSLRIKAGGIERPMVFGSREMQDLVQIVDRVAPTDATVLITGESGTGKELVARRIHVQSKRAEKPFVIINAAALPADLLESELFGHERGSFTGATAARQGRFRQADGGTVFIDEVGELPLQLQAKVLRALQEKAVDVVGADTPVPVDIRLISATNKKLEKEIGEGRFREDLYYRLKVVELYVPPLRERPEDIEILANHFIRTYSESREISIPRELMEQLRQRRWAGNVRELENVCQRLIVLSQGPVLALEHLPPETVSRPGHSRSDDLLDDWPPLPGDGLSLVDLEKRVIERVLALKRGNITQAALYLKVPRHVLAYRMQKYGIVRSH